MAKGHARLVVEKVVASCSIQQAGGIPTNIQPRLARQQVKASQLLAAKPDFRIASDRPPHTLKAKVESLLVIALFLLPLAQTRAFAQSGSDQYGQPYSGGQSGYDQQQPYSDSGQGYPQQEYSQQPSQGLRNDVQPLSAGQLEQLVAPIALYPDALVAQVLAASTYPQQVADADRWRQAERYAPPEQIAAGADVQPWDPSVKALTAFPQVLAQMDRNLSWTTALGNAYYNQPQDVLEAVQIMRRRAQSAGTLQSSPQEVVREDQGTIVLEPPTPQVVYVPAYNPWTAYGEPVTPYPGISLLGAIGSFVGEAFGGSSFGGSTFGGSSPLSFGLGIAMSAFTHTPWGWLAWGLDWLGHALLFDHSDYYSHSATVADWGFPRHGFYAYSHRGFDRRGDFRHDDFRRGDFAGMHGKGRGRGEFNSGPWHNFDRARDGRADWQERGRGEHSWEQSNRGFDRFRDARRSETRPMNAYNPGERRMQDARPAYRSDFGRRESGAGFNRGTQSGTDRFGQSFRSPNTGFDRREFSARSSAPVFDHRSFAGRGFAGRNFAPGKQERSGGLHLFGGGNKDKNFNGGGFGGRGFGNFREARAPKPPKFHAPKNFGGGRGFGGGKGFGGGRGSGGGKSFGGGHSHSGGHSGGRHHG